METPPRFRGLLSTGDGIALVGIFLTAGLAIWQSKSSGDAAELQHRQASTMIAVGILSARALKDKDGNIQEFEPDQQGLRRWAIQILNDNAKIKIPEEAAEVIATGRAGISSGYGSYYTDYNYDSYGAYYDVVPTPGAGSPAPDAPGGKR